MALIKLGAMFDEISGKVGGQSISNRGATTVISNITHTNKTPTIKQSKQRALTAALSNSWQFLTTVQQDSFKSAAVNYTYTNRVGQTVTRNGFQTYCFINQNLSIIGKSWLSSAPAYVPVTEPKINLVDISSGNFEIQSNNASSTYLYALFAAPNLSAGSSNAISKMKFCGYITAASLNAGYDVIADIESVYGALSFPNTISIIIDPINQTTGNRLQEVTEIYNEEKPMILEVTVANGDTITIPFAAGGTFSGTVDFGNGVSRSFSAYNDANLTETYTNGGTYLITLSGTFTRFNVNNGAFKAYFTNILQFGTNEFNILSFYGSNQLTVVTPNDTPSFSAAASLINCFYQLTSIVSFANLEKWDVSNVRTWNLTFYGSLLGALDLRNFIFSSATSLLRTFYQTSFILDFSNSDLSLVTTFFETFRYFNGTIYNLDTIDIKQSGAVNVSGMLRDSNIDVDAGAWVISNITNFTNWSSSGSLSNSNWDNCLNGWAAQATIPIGIVISVNATHTAASAAAYTTLTTTYSWTINEGV